MGYGNPLHEDPNAGLTDWTAGRKLLGQTSEFPIVAPSAAEVTDVSNADDDQDRVDDLDRPGEPDWGEEIGGQYEGLEPGIPLDDDLWKSEEEVVTDLPTETTSLSPAQAQYALAAQIAGSILRGGSVASLPAKDVIRLADKIFDKAEIEGDWAVAP